MKIMMWDPPTNQHKVAHNNEAEMLRDTVTLFIWGEYTASPDRPLTQARYAHPSKLMCHSHNLSDPTSHCQKKARHPDMWGVGVITVVTMLGCKQLIMWPEHCHVGGGVISSTQVNSTITVQCLFKPSNSLQYTVSD